MKKLFSFLIVIIFFVFIFFIPQKHSLEDIKGVKIAGQNIKVELALTPAEHAQGLSGQSGLKKDAGMLFIFPQSGNYPRYGGQAFWMKDMNFAIDIIWLDEDMKVIYIKKDARPELYPETYGPEDSAKYVLEVVSGFAEKNNLQIGDGVEFTR